MSTTLNRSRREHREPTRSDYDCHENRLFEIAKEATFAADPNRTAHSLAQIAMWLDGGSSSPVALSPIERADLIASINEAERNAYRSLPECFDRSVIDAIFSTWRSQIERWATVSANRATGPDADNLRDLARIWRNALHSAVLAQDVAERAGRVHRWQGVICRLLHEPAPMEGKGL